MGKRFSGVVELASELSGSGDFACDLAASLSRRKITSTLAAMRAAKGMTQGQVAEAMGCSLRWVNKLENSEDVSLSFRWIVLFARAVGFDVELVFHHR